ncbi:hypothetical protein NS277_08240 [Novosphingobium barchaimii]|nr:hypothetical protein NS277_08240 [Novosphingobium barchaimii]
MERTILITGAASGMGKALCAHLRGKGHTAIGVDLRDTDIVADLGTRKGREHMVAEAQRLISGGVSGRLDGVVAAAGVSQVSAKLTGAVNYYGAIATLEGLRPLLAQSKSPRAVLITSTASFLEIDAEFLALLQSGDEDKLSGAPAMPDGAGYSASKFAVAQWLRRAATSAEWAGAGILLNAIGPGRIRTPMIEPILATEEGRAMLAQVTPIALDRPYGEAIDIAEAASFLLEVETSFIVGQILYVDGGTDALMRPERI